MKDVQPKLATVIKPQNLEEKVVWYYIIGTYGLYFLGAQFVVAPVMAWLLVLYLVKKLWNQTEATPVEERITIPIGIWVWIVSMLVLEFALIMGHYDFDLTIIQAIKASVKFAKSWALFAIFPLIGCLKIRPQIISRAVCILGLQSLIFIPICYLASVLKLPGMLYISPLNKIFGNSFQLYNVNLYIPDYEANFTRLFLFAPWGPVLGVVGCMYFFIACQDQDNKWQRIGIIAAIAMACVSGSRAALVCILTIPFIVLLLAKLGQSSVQIATGISSFFIGIIGTQLLDWFISIKDEFYARRSSSSNVREILNNLALYRWWNEAPVWGHGVVESRGPKVTGLIQVGTHHTWLSVLFLHGIVGAIALAFPMLWSFVYLLIKAQKSIVTWGGIGILLVLFFFCFVEKLDYVAYVFWPGLVILGIALKE